MEVKEVNSRDNLEEIESIVCDPEIYNRITDDKCPPLDRYKFHDPFDSMYIGCYTEGKLIGLLISHDGEIHFNFLKNYRKGSMKSEFLHKALTMIKKPLRVEIPSLYPECIHFAKQEGFREKRIVKNTFPKNGKLYDIHILVHR